MASSYTPLPIDWYQRPTWQVARELLGQHLWRQLPTGEIVGGRIVETEAYTPDDPACHAHRGTTARARSMFKPGGIAYVYIIYGMYYCLNAVTQAEGEGAAVLIRAIEPLQGQATMAQLRSIDSRKLRDLARGPGRLCQALAVDRALDGTALDQPPLWIATGAALPDTTIIQTPRIGINVTPAAQQAPWRFIVRDCPYVSGTRRQNMGEAYYPTPDWFSG